MKFIFSLIFFFLLFIGLDNIYYSKNIIMPNKKSYVFHARHSANTSYNHAPPKGYIEISDKDLSTEKVDFRTGAYGEILPHGGTGDCKIFFLGGSTTETHWVNEESRWPYLVGKTDALKNNVKTYNFGVGGQNIHHSTLRLLSYILEQNPNIVVINHASNDISKFMKGDYYTKEGDLYNSYTVLAQPNLTGRVRNILENLIPTTNSLWRTFRNRATFNKRSRTQPPENTAKPLLVENYNNLFQSYTSRILMIKSLLDKKGIALVVLEQPERYKELLTTHHNDTQSRKNLLYSLSTNGLNAEQFLFILKRFQSELKTWAAKSNIHFISSETMPSSTEFFYDAIHFNKKGSHEFANLIGKKLSSVVSKSCTSKPKETSL